MLAGRWLLSVPSGGVADFLVADGLVLLALAVSGGGHEARGSSARRDVGAVPIGTPLLAGPATLATLLILVDRYGTALALAVTHVCGRTGLAAASRVASLLLSAIASSSARRRDPDASAGRAIIRLSRQRPGGQASGATPVPHLNSRVASLVRKGEFA